MPLLSIIVSCYNEEDAIPFFHDELVLTLARFPKDLRCEIWLVDDGSTDGTLALMESISAADSRFKYISLSRNFGKEAAMLAGFDAAQGDFVALLDADLQDPPSLMLEMYDILSWSDEYDCVGSRRVTRKGEPPIRSWFARKFYRMINSISRTEVVDGARDFRMMRRPMVDAILSLREQCRFSKGLFSWVGFRTKWLEYENIERVAGETKWSFWRLFLYSLDGIISLSTIPLNIALIVGVVLMALFVPFLLLALFLPAAPAWLATASIACLIGGAQILFVGILGLYLSKVHMEVQQRPIYIIRRQSERLSENGEGE